jgi:heme oxygenase
MISAVHNRLREATRADHERLESRIDILQRAATTAGRRDLVETFSGFHTDAEAALEPWLADLPGLDFAARRRSQVLADDLRTVDGVRPSARPIRVDGVPDALGLMYVLEGSTLGGRVIRRQLAADGHDMVGLSFLDPYGEAVGERWRAFLAVLAAEARTEADAAAMVAGARQGFRHAEQRLCATVDG